MQTTILGRTNLTVSRMGLGAGGHSRIGRNVGLTDAQSAALVRRALDHGVNFIDTAEGYGTESIIGQALQGRRPHRRRPLHQKIYPQRTGHIRHLASQPRPEPKAPRH